MGSFDFSPITANSTNTTLTWAGLSEQQKLYIGLAYDYTAQIDDGAGNMIDNVPLMAFVLMKMFAEMSQRAEDKYVLDNSASVKAAAAIVADFVPE